MVRGDAEASNPLSRAGSGETAIEKCVREELQRYFELIDGESPGDLYRTVMGQAEAALLRAVLDACGGNRSRAALWLGISRGTLRGKLEELGGRRRVRPTEDNRR